MAGTKKPAKLSFENMTKEESRKYFMEQMARAKKTLDEKMKQGDEKGIKHAQNIITNLEGMISRL